MECRGCLTAQTVVAAAKTGMAGLRFPQSPARRLLHRWRGQQSFPKTTGKTNDASSNALTCGPVRVHPPVADLRRIAAAVA